MNFKEKLGNYTWTFLNKYVEFKYFEINIFFSILDEIYNNYPCKMCKTNFRYLLSTGKIPDYRTYCINKRSSKMYVWLIHHIVNKNIGKKSQVSLNEYYTTSKNGCINNISSFYVDNENDVRIKTWLDKLYKIINK